MPIPQTQEEFLASQINPRNYSDILPIIYYLRTREDEEYVPEAFDRSIPSFLAVGENGGAAVFSGLQQESYARGTHIVISGAATYKMINGAAFEFRPSIQITAQIDIGRQSPPTSLPAYQVECSGVQINENGIFSFSIPPSVTQRLSVGTHYVYLDAHSPNNPPVRLTAVGDGAVNDERSFRITA